MEYDSGRFIFEGSHTTIKFDPQDKIMLGEFRGLANRNLKEFREGLGKVLAFNSQFSGYKGSIADLRNLHGNFRGLLAFLENEYFPKIAEYRREFIILLLPEDLIINHLSEKIREAAGIIKIIAIKDADRAEQEDWVLDLLEKYQL